MKTIAALHGLLRGRMLVRLAVAIASLAGASVVQAVEHVPARSPQIFLEAALTRPNDPRLEAAIKGALLLRYGRLLPEGFSTEAMKRLGDALGDPDPSHESALQEQVAAFPAVDELAFDGQRYAGGNLSHIDAMLGDSGRPIAFDRELPSMLVPLTPEAEAALVERRATFQKDLESKKSRDTADQIFGDGAAALMVADGQFLRRYAGRFDDLYFHLFQNGNGASALAFCGLAGGLADRVYQPLNGLRRRDTAPAAKFDLDDILSGGGKAAVRRHLRERSDRGTDPFQQFAFHVLPTIVTRLRALPAGARFTATHAEVIQALRARQHFYPTQVAPLYRSPDRFLGWAGYVLTPVANHPALPPGAADSWYPLPERDKRAPADQAAEGAASDQLFESSSTAVFVWDDPQYSELLADPEARIESPKATAKEKSPAPESTNPAPSQDPRRRATTGRSIAVVTPTADEAKAYLASIATSDETLRTIEQTRGRIRMLREFIAQAGTAAPGEATDPSSRTLGQAIAADLASFDKRESELAAGLQVALKQRADLRSELEKRLLLDRVSPLRALGKKPGERESREEPALVL